MRESPDVLHGEQRFVWPVRVYYEDTDSAGVVYYANYLRYFERARTEWLRALGFEQTDIATQYGVVFVVRTAHVEYLQPARLNDALRISVELSEVGASQITVTQQVMRGQALLVDAQMRLACVSIASMKPVRIPTPLRKAVGIKIRTP